ncbi:hypothetical protein FB107DRAFT_281006 [Schizophyllum commune]
MVTVALSIGLLGLRRWMAEGTYAFGAVTSGVARSVRLPHTAVVFANRPGSISPS